jgi:predicted nucleotidyltransferase
MSTSVHGDDPQALIDEMKRRLLDRWEGEITRIILYGSRARGSARPDSDFDLLVVYANDMSRREARRRFREALGELRPLADLRVVTDAQFAAGRDVVGCLVEAADRSGRTLHAR